MIPGLQRGGVLSGHNCLPFPSLPFPGFIGSSLQSSVISCVQALAVFHKKISGGLTVLLEDALLNRANQSN